MLLSPDLEEVGGMTGELEEESLGTVNVLGILRFSRLALSFIHLDLSAAQILLSFLGHALDSFLVPMSNQIMDIPSILPNTVPVPCTCVSSVLLQLHIRQLCLF